MSDQFLEVYYENAQDDLDDLLELVSNPKYGLQIYLQICRSYRIIGICSLLVNMDVGAMMRALNNSASAYLSGMRKNMGEVVVSRSFPLFDAIACGNEMLIKQLSESLLQCELKSELEYEEDCLYMKIIAALAINKPSLVNSYLERYDEIKGDADELKFALCRSLADNIQEDFIEAFEGIVEERRVEIERKRSSGAVSDEFLATEGSIFLEGVALKNLALGRGFEMEDNYIFIPSFLRVGSNEAYDMDAWRSVE